MGHLVSWLQRERGGAKQSLAQQVSFVARRLCALSQVYYMDCGKAGKDKRWRYPRIVFMTSSFANTAGGPPAKIIAPRSMAYSRSATLAALIKLDSAMSTEIRIALICLTASAKRLTTTGARPSKASSSSKTEGARAMARAMATI